MNKIVAYLLICVVAVMLQTLQWNQQMAINSFFNLKYAVNRGAHAAVQQWEQEAWAEGRVVIDEERAEQVAREYLFANVQLDVHEQHGQEDDALQGALEVLHVDVIQHNFSFPYRYVRPEYNYEVVFQRPGVVLIVRRQQPAASRLFGEMNWIVKGAAEVVY